MTDGIIQKVFREYTNGGIKSSLFSLSMIEQELIQEIKKTYLGYSSLTNKKTLIGDTNE